MLLKSFGCSFIYGSDLSDLHKPGYPSNLTWPALLANDLGRDYHCHAQPGSGNLQIAEQVLKYLNLSGPDCVYAIGWSWIDRYDYIDSTSHWATIRPTTDTTQAHYYYKNFHSQHADKLNSLIIINSVISLLLKNNVQFIMTYTDDLLFETEYYPNNAIVQLQQAIQPYVTTFEGQTFLNWTKEKGFPISDTLHPLESAHHAAFELIKNSKQWQ